MADPFMLPDIVGQIVNGSGAGDEWRPQGGPVDAPMPRKRRGLFGGKLDMEDFQMALARAAAYFDGDYAGAAAITGHMGKARQGRLDAAQLATMLAQDDTLTDQQRQMFSMSPDAYFKYATDRLKPTEQTNDYRKYREMGYSDAEIQQQMRQDAEASRSRIVSTTEGGAAGTWAPGKGYTPIVLPNPGDAPAGAPVTPPVGQKTVGGKTYRQDASGDWYEVGGGVSNGPGGFRP